MSSPSSGTGTSGPGRSGPGRPGTGPTGPASTGKGRPTPKRSQAQPRRGGPVQPPPQTRKEAAQRAREQAKQARENVRAGRQLLPRDAGPVRALVRDVVDARRGVGVLMLPLAVLLVVAQLLAESTGVRRVLDIAFFVWLVGLAALAVDLVLLTRALRRRLTEEHPEVTRRRGHIAYGLLRSTVFRRLRVPAPRVPRGGGRTG